MLINSPSNPTGQVFSNAVLAVISDFCRNKGIILISDEIYSDLCFDPSSVQNSAFTSNCEDAGIVIMTGGLSKVGF